MGTPACIIFETSLELLLFGIPRTDARDDSPFNRYDPSLDNADPEPFAEGILYNTDEGRGDPPEGMR